MESVLNPPVSKAERCGALPWLYEMPACALLTRAVTRWLLRAFQGSLMFQISVRAFKEGNKTGQTVQRLDSHHHLNEASPLFVNSLNVLLIFFLKDAMRWWIQPQTRREEQACSKCSLSACNLPPVLPSPSSVRGTFRVYCQCMS